MSLSYAQLEQLWTQAGGAPAWAPTMAAVAMLESGGDPNANNPSGATGLWQIEWPLHQGEGAGNPQSRDALYDPLTNAQTAVYLLGTGSGISAWGTGTGDSVGTYVQTQNNSQPMTEAQLDAAGFSQYTGAPASNLPAASPGNGGGGATAGGGQAGAPYTPSSIPGIPATPPDLPDFTANPTNELSRIISWGLEFSGWALFTLIVLLFGIVLLAIGAIVMITILAGPVVGPIAAMTKTPVGQGVAAVSGVANRRKAANQQAAEDADAAQLEAQRVGTSEPRSARQANREAEVVFTRQGRSRPGPGDRSTGSDRIRREYQTHRGRRVPASASGPAF